MKSLRVFVLFLFFLSFPVYLFAQPADLKIHFIDVGEGDAIFIEAPNNRTALVDTGNLITGFRVAEYLRQNDIQDLDYLIFTHHDPDHIGGAFYLLQIMNVHKIYDNGQNFTNITRFSDIHRWYEELVRGKGNYGALKTGDVLSLGKVTLRVLWPSRPLLSYNFNANSLVIMVEYGEFRCLLTGDCITPVERELLQYATDLGADVLKVGHHGAGDASSEEFIKAVSPDIAIISVKKDNSRGYASAAVLDRLENAGAEIYRTDKNGDIIIIAQPDGKFRIEEKIVNKAEVVRD